MRLPVIRGLIRRRLLINFRVDPGVLQPLLPAGFRPKLHQGHAIAGICLIRLEAIRPAGWPAMLGMASENAAHRIAVTWSDGSGESHEGVFIPRRDTGSRLNHWAGGRLFPGEHHPASFVVTDTSGAVNFAMQARDGGVRVAVRGHDAETWPAESCFASLGESSRFFEGGSVGFSVTRDPRRLDGLKLATKSWQVRPFKVEHVESSFFADQSVFPPGAVTFDHALVMRDIPHEWHQVADFRIEDPSCCGSAVAVAS